MAEIALPVVVTAIADATTEGFIAGTLYGQGWSVVYRALDADSLRSFIRDSNAEVRDAVLIFSPDLISLSPSDIDEYQRIFRRVVGFSNSPSTEYSALMPVPKTDTELLNCIRGSVRSPLIRSQPLIKPRARARVIGIASPSGATGCTTIALNLAMEMSVIGKETLLIDADVHSPSVALLLGLHKLENEELAREVAINLKVTEFTQNKMGNLAAYIENALQNFDCVVIDLGSIEELSDSLTDRRWSATLVHWACEHADEIVFVGKSEPLSLHRFESLLRSLSKVTISARVSFLLNMQGAGRKKNARDAQFLAACAPLHPHRIVSAPRDSSTLAKAEADRATLFEVSDRSRLRRAISKLAVELQS